MAEEIIIKKKGIDLKIVDEIVDPEPNPEPGVPKFDVRSTTTLAPGSQATVDLELVTDTYLFDFGIPKGDKGEKGDKGDSIKGDAGLNATVTVGTTTTLAPGSPATVTGVVQPNNGLQLNFGIPKGADGVSSGGGSNITSSRGFFDVMRDFGAKGDGVTDDTNALQAAINAWIAIDGTLFIPSPPNFYKITRTLVIGSSSDNQIWGHIAMNGSPQRNIRYMGASNSAAIKIYGMKGGSISGLHVGIANGITNTAAVDIVTENISNSTATFSVYDWVIYLGNGAGNSGVRFGKTRSGNGDVSQIQLFNVMVWGSGGALGASIPGQNGFEVNDGNTCQLSWYSCGGALLDHAWHVNQGSGLYFYLVGGSNNNTDFYFNYPSTYTINGNRFESGRKHVYLGGGGHSTFVENNTLISNYGPTDGRLIEVQANASVTIHDLKVEQTRVALDARTIYLGTSSNFSTLAVRGGAFQVPTADFITVANPSRWAVRVDNVGRLDSNYQVTSLFQNR